MKAILVLLFAAALLHAEEPATAPAPAPAASAVLAAIAGGASSPSEPTARAEPAERAEPAAPGGDAIQHSALSTQHSPLSATVSLSDGSILKGTLRPRFLPAVSPSLGRVRIDLAKVERIDFIPTSGGNSAGLDRRDRLARLGSQAAQVQQVQSVQPVHDCRVSFTNGDTLTATLSPRHDRFVLDTLLGRVRLPLRAVSSISFNPSTPSTVSTSSTPSTLLYHCTFDSPSSISRPAAGPAGAFLGGEFVPGKKGRALLVKARTPAAEVPFPTGLMRPEGCIEFWARIPGATKETRYPDGGNPMFFAMGVGKWVNTFVKYTANDGFGTGGLHADLPGSAYVSSLPSWGGSAAYPDFLGDPAAWHHYALVWSEKGLDAASEALGRRVVSALYVDGRLVNPAYGTNGPDRAKFLREFVVNPVVLGFPFLRERQDPNQSQVDYLIDEFKIWSAPVVQTE